MRRDRGGEDGVVRRLARRREVDVEGDREGARVEQGVRHGAVARSRPRPLGQRAQARRVDRDERHVRHVRGERRRREGLEAHHRVDHGPLDELDRTGVRERGHQSRDGHGPTGLPLPGEHPRCFGARG